MDTTEPLSLSQRDWVFPGSSEVKNPTTIEEMWVPSLGGEGALEKKMATCSKILTGKSHDRGAFRLRDREQLAWHHTANWCQIEASDSTDALEIAVCRWNFNSKCCRGNVSRECP